MKTARQIVSDLVKSGENETSIAKAIGCAQSTINRINTGAILNPRFDVWSRLNDLHKKLSSNDDPKGDEAA